VVTRVGEGAVALDSLHTHPHPHIVPTDPLSFIDRFDLDHGVWLLDPRQQRLSLNLSSLLARSFGIVPRTHTASPSLQRNARGVKIHTALSGVTLDTNQ
jgi:hypothetical protein